MLYFQIKPGFMLHNWRDQFLNAPRLGAIILKALDFKKRRALRRHASRLFGRHANSHVSNRNYAC